MLVPHTGSPPSPDSPPLAPAEEAASPMIGFAGLYDRPLGVAGPKPTGSRFSAWHKLPSMPQSLQDQGTSQGASCWTWERAAESRNGKTKPCCGPANTDTWDSHLLLFLLLLFFPPPSAAPWGWEWQPLAVRSRSSSTTAVCWSSPIQKRPDQILAWCPVQCKALDVHTTTSKLSCYLVFEVWGIL